MSEDRSRIDELNKSLYSRNAQEIRAGRKNHFTQKEFEVNTDWEHPEEPLSEIKLTDHYEDNSMSFFTKLLIGSFVFFVIAVGIGAYLLFNGANIVSANNVDIQVSGPISVSGGEPISLNVQVLNKN